MREWFSASNWVTAAAAVVALGVVVLLFAEIVRTERAQQEVSEEALTDFAEVAAWQYASWAEFTLQPHLLNPIEVFRDEAKLDEPLERVFGQALDRAVGCPCPHGTRPGAGFRYDGRELEFTGPEVVLERSALGEHLTRVADRYSPEREFGEDIDFIPLGEGALAVVATVHEASDPVVTGFVARTEPMEGVFEDVFQDHDLLPADLVGNLDERELVGIRVESDAGVLFETEGFGGPWRGLRTGAQAADIYSGLRVRSTLTPRAAEVLLPGGQPQSRIPLLLTLLGVAVLLGTMATWQFLHQRRLMRMRTDTVARISHELRTPLAQIRLFTDTLRLGRTASAGDRERALAIIDRESRRLDHLIHNVLRFGAGGAAGEELNPRPLDLQGSLTEIAGEFRPLAEHAGARLLVEVAEAPSIEADPEALRRMVLNLLDNAAKFGPEGGTITLSAEAPGSGDVRIRVTDEGPGIPARDRDRIWRMYDRPAPNSATGSGIGLAVVRQYAEAHGGQAWVEDATGGGACFVVALPAAR